MGSKIDVDKKEGSKTKIDTLGMIGCGSMGGGMALLFAEHGLTVSLSDPAEEAMDGLIKEAKEKGFGDRLKKFKDQAEMAKSLNKPRVIAFSLPHGTVGDTVLEGLLPVLEKGDIILDAANEWYENTERRQGKCVTRGIKYIGMGVSGGYQAARNGPSMCPGGDEATLSEVLPLLEQVAAKDKQGRPAVAACGFGGSGHYVKMIHNGIEHGMMSAIAESFNIMRDGLSMKDEEIADVFEKWNKEGELQGTFLIDISTDICRKTFPQSDAHVLDTILDKVVQDMTGEEGTGVWSNMEAVRLHIAAPTLSTAHYLRIASAFRGQREKVHKTFSVPVQKLSIPDDQKPAFIERLRIAVYTACLASFIQGVNVIDAANKENKWNIDYAAVWQIWRAGCIIQADYISDNILGPVFKNATSLPDLNMLTESDKALNDLANGYPKLKEVLAEAMKADLIVPALSATAEWIKIVSGTNLPTGFYEAQLDYFGKHMYDSKGDDVPGPTEGKHHFEWKPASKK